MHSAARWGLGLAMNLLLACAALAQGVESKPMSRAQALQALDRASPAQRQAGIERLADIGTMADANRVVLRLYDDDTAVRDLAAASLWQIWGRSGDKTIDAQYQKGVQLMEARRFGEAIVAFSGVIKKRPDFAEAWNKRATVYYLLEEFELSLKDCDEVMKRNPHHFGALSGYGQIYLHLGDLQRALDAFERALKVNPNLPGAVETVNQLQRQLRSQGRNAA